MPIEIQDSLEKFIKQMIFSRSKAIPEFKSLKPSVQVRNWVLSFLVCVFMHKLFEIIWQFLNSLLFQQDVMLKNNFVAMLRLGTIEFFHDIISIVASNSFAILCEMYIIWETSFWNKNSIKGPPSTRIEMKRLIRKVRL